MPLVIASCTNRKRRPAPAILRAHALGKGSLEALAADWRRRIAAAERDLAAGDLYGGSSVMAARAAARRLDAQLHFVSAGLGFIAADELVPSYALTVVDGEDNVLDRLDPPAGAADWWAALDPTAGQRLAETIDATSGPVLVALPGGYVTMLAGILEALGSDRLNRVRLFTRAAGDVPPALRSVLMPYDARLDGPDSPQPGTVSSFAARALRDFAEHISPVDPATDAAAVAERLASWRAPDRRAGARRSDADILTLIRTHWDRAGGRTGLLLRVLRDELGVACEQGRFARLVHTVRAEALA